MFEINSGRSMLATQFRLSTSNLIPPDVDRISLIVESALTAQSLFFAASLHHPEQAELHQVFETFVLNCVMPPEIRSYP
jgi:hypothetical protein